MDMRLEEQFLKLYPHQSENYLDTDEAEKCVEITENFAIGFAEWCNSNYGFDFGSWVTYENREFKRYSTKQLLEIYKETL